MNRATLDQGILDEALRQFQRSTGLCASSAAPDIGSNVIVQVSVWGEVRRYTAIVKTRVDRAAVSLSVLDQPGSADAPPILVAPHVSSAIACVCRQHDLAFMDCAGNAFLQAPGMLVIVTGHRPSKSAILTQRGQRTFGESGLRIIYNCLAEPALFQGSYRDIARASGTALGTVSGILSELRAQGLLAEDKKGRRHWISKQRVIEAWLVNYPLALRPKLEPRRFRARDETWWKRLTPTVFGMQWGAEVAAARLMSELEPRTVTLYAHQAVARLLAAQRLIADPDGHVEILRAFWPLSTASETDADLVSPLLICADLLWIADPRTVQAARAIRENLLA